jgi:hypothetical protein
MKNVMLHLLFLIFAILGAPYLILHSSRYVSYFKVFFKTLIALFLLYSPKDRDGTSVWEGTLYTLSVIVLFPFAFAKALDTVVQGGKIFWVTDDELYQELGWFYSLFLSCFGMDGDNVISDIGECKNGENEKDKNHSK